MCGKSLMSWFDGLEEIIKQNEPLTRYNWFRLGGAAEFFIRPQSVQQLQDVTRRCSETGIPTRVLGLGANLLVNDDGVKGAVIKLDAPAFTEIRFDGARCFCGAGVDMQTLVFQCQPRGKRGLECLAGIPGTVGGGARMNAGGRFGDIGTRVQRLKLMDDEGTVFYREKPELIFSYRNCNVQEPYILGAEFTLDEDDPDRIMQAVNEVLRYKKNSQPLSSYNAGCIFKNPEGVSAGSLIDRAGLKGYREGTAMVSDMHANFIITDSSTRCTDVQKLIGTMQKKVHEQFGVVLETEIVMW